MGRSSALTDRYYFVIIITVFSTNLSKRVNKYQKRKQDIVTFKVSDSLMEAIKGILNWSGFIRTATVVVSVGHPNFIVEVFYDF